MGKGMGDEDICNTVNNKTLKRKKEKHVHHIHSFAPFFCQVDLTIISQDENPANETCGIKSYYKADENYSKSIPFILKEHSPNIMSIHH